MLSHLFLLTSLLLLAVSLFAWRLPEVHRKFSLAILQSLLFLPLLAAQYLATALHLLPDAKGFTIVLVSQNIFLLVWGSAARRLRDAMATGKPSPSAVPGLLHSLLAVLILAVTVFQFLAPGFTITREGIRFSPFDPVYFASLLSLLVMLFMTWQLEAFWRQLPKTRRREYGLFVLSCALVCIVQGGVASYRVTYLELTNELLSLQATFLLIAWILLAFAVLRHRLLNRNLFISRKIVYSFVAPSLFAAYFLALGTISLVMRISDYPIEWMLFWFLAGIGAVGASVLAASEPVRQRLKFFISTHFYVNKYEYRDEWLAFSALLQGAHTEATVLEALRQILVDSLYTREIRIWSGSKEDGFELAVSPGDTEGPPCRFPANHPLIQHLRQQPRLDLSAARQTDSLSKSLAALPPPRPVLFVPLTAGGQLLGCIGLGPEYTGGRYGQDDFDLLEALSSQAALALLAVRLTEETARLHERRALNNLSTFLLHDIKNAASILSLVQTNAREHLDKPEFRQDMLTAISDALRRMDKVRINLGMLRDRVKSVWQDMALHPFLDELADRFGRRLPGLEIVLDCPAEITLRTDPQLLGSVLENLLLNAFEAAHGSCQVHIRALATDDELTISVTNNGPPIPTHLLPDQLFAPYVSDKPGGSGIGLWQVRMVLQRLGGAITAENPANGGARFVIRLPMADSSLAAVDPAAQV